MRKHKFRDKKKTTIEDVRCVFMLNLNGDKVVPLTDSSGEISYVIYYKYNHNRTVRRLIYTPSSGEVHGLSLLDDTFSYRADQWLRDLMAGVTQSAQAKFQDIGHMALTVLDRQLIDDAIKTYLDKIREKM